MRIEDLKTDIDAQNEGMIFHVIEPRTGRKTDLWFRIAGPDSEVRREADWWYTRERSKFRDMRVSGMNWYSVPRDPTPIEATELAIGQLARVVVDMGGLVENGDPVPYSVESVERLLRLVPWIREQVDLYAATRSVYATAITPPEPQAVGEDGWPIEDHDDA